MKIFHHQQKKSAQFTCLINTIFFSYSTTYKIHLQFEIDSHIFRNYYLSCR
nr:MAG TPA: hypothetical protein [Caudoviricetes sp.]